MTEKDLQLIERARTLHWMEIDDERLEDQAETKEAKMAIHQIAGDKYHMEEMWDERFDDVYEDEH